MNILILNYEWPPLGGGGGPVAEDLAQGYVKAGHKVDVITARYKDQPLQETRHGVNLHRIKCWRTKKETCETHEMISFVMAAIKPTKQFINKNKVDIIHCHFAVPTGLLAWWVTKRRDVKYILTCHGSDIPGYNPQRFTLAHRITPPILKPILKQAAAIVSPSHWLAGHIRQTCGDFSTLSVVPNGIDVAQFETGPKCDPPRVLMAGRLLHRKGFGETLEALALLHEEDPSLEFEVHIAGDGPQRGEMETTAKRLPEGWVTFHGWLNNDSPQLSELYRTSAIFSMPSEKENASISLLEAMASRMAVVTSDRSGCPETVGDSGIVVPPRDTQKLADVLRPLLNDPAERDRLGAAARERVELTYDLAVITARYIQVLEKHKI